MGRLKDGMLQSLRFNKETKTWYTKTWDLKKNPKSKTVAEEAKTKIADGEGLTLFLTDGGNMIWRIEYRWQKARRTYTVGMYTNDSNSVSLLKARETLIQVKKWLKENKDPAEEKRNLEKKQTEQLITFENISREWFEQTTIHSVENHRKIIIRMLENYIFPFLGNVPITDIKGKDIIECLRKIEDKGYFDIPHRLANIIARIFRYAILLGHCEVNIASDLRFGLKVGEKKNFPALTDPKKIGSLLLAIDSLEGHWAYLYALKIIPYVFVRNSELCNAKWSEFDLENAIWIIPADRMKKRRQHLVPLASQVVTLLKKLDKNKEYVFPSVKNSSKPIDKDHLLEYLHKTGFTKNEICIHGFRSIASTYLNEQGFRPDVIEIQLAHVQNNNVRAAYNRAVYLDERREMMQKYADYLDSLKILASKK
ncbi:MAG: tyrosine-type recombinase/integrase [Desulfovibrionaceae bacterium]|nr:tyrosine-type recombinase/integrase [Desulfovibrionaceae bacterium]